LVTKSRVPGNFGADHDDKRPPWILMCMRQKFRSVWRRLLVRELLDHRPTHLRKAIKCECSSFDALSSAASIAKLLTPSDDKFCLRTGITRSSFRIGTPTSASPRVSLSGSLRWPTKAPRIAGVSRSICVPRAKVAQSRTCRSQSLVSKIRLSIASGVSWWLHHKTWLPQTATITFSPT
jgi:hypothetical protein